MAFGAPLAGSLSPDSMLQQHALGDAPITGSYTNNMPATYMLVAHDPLLTAFRLNKAPLGGQGTEAVWLPMPDGNYRKFNVWQQPVLDVSYRDNHPDILALMGRADDDPTVRVGISYSPNGFNAMVDLGDKTWFIDQHPNKAQPYSIAYLAGATSADIGCICDDNAPAAKKAGDKAASVPENCIGTQLRQFDVAIATSERVTAQFANRNDALAHVNTLVNRLNVIYERDLGATFNLVSGLATIYEAGVNPEPNPYPHEGTGGPGGVDLQNSHNNLNASLPGISWDFGFSLTDLGFGGGSGVAFFGVCNPNVKGRQISSFGNHDNGVPDFYLGLIAHEIGHQFGAAHTFTAQAGNCDAGNFGGAPSAVEVGSGSTIMSYAGICGVDNLQNSEDLYFHGASLRQMNDWISNNDCSTPIGTVNAIPTISATDCQVPLMTPFELTATASDANGDALSYTWEQIDTSPRHPITQLDDGVIPLYRSYPPSTSPTRSFPSLSAALTGTLPFGEKWHTVPRTLNFLSTVRDGNGGTCSFAVEVDVVNAGPLSFTAPTTGASESCQTTVTWNPNGTDLAPLSAATVNILLTTDSGTSYTTLATGVPNNGRATVPLPTINTTNARFRIEPENGCWYVLSDAFTITPCPSADLVINKTGPDLVEINETFTYTLTVTNLGPQTANNVTITDVLPTGLTPVSGTGPFNAGTLAPGASATFSIDVTAAGPVRIVQNCASVDGLFDDPDMSNNTNCLNTSVVDARGDLSLTVDGTANGVCNSTIVYNILVSNLSNFVAENTVITNLIPDACFTPTALSAQCVETSPGTIVCTIPSIGIGGTQSLLIQGTVEGCCSTITNAATLTQINDTNALNNVDSHVVTITPDTERPTFGTATDVDLGCNPLATAFPNPNALLATASDNCNVATSFFSQVANADPCAREIRYDYVARDDCGNEGVAGFTVFWIDDPNAPAFTNPPPLTQDLGCNPDASAFPDIAAVLASATDLCGVTATSVTAVTNGGPCVFTATYTWSATDGCNNTTNLTTSTTWREDTEAPSFADCTPAAVDLGCNPAPAEFPDPQDVLDSASDNCGVVTSWVEVVQSTNGCDITMQETFYAVDACSLTGTCQRTITWIDSFDLPTLNPPPPATLDLGCNPLPTDFPDTAAVLAGATDDCSITASNVMVTTNGGPCNFSATYTYTVVDTCTQTGTFVTVVSWIEDTVAPAFADCSPALTNLGCNPLPADFPDPNLVLDSAMDNCGVVNRWVDSVRTTNGCDVTMLQTFYAVDACNQTGTCQRTIAWTDSTGIPSFTNAPAAMIDLGCNPVASDFPDPDAILASAIDDCGIASSSFMAVTNGGPCTYTSVYTWTAIDTCGVTGTVVSVLTWIEDIVTPLFIDCTPSTIDLGCNPQPADFPDPALVLASAADNCGVVNRWVDTAETTNDCAITRVETFYAVDACNQTGTCQRTIMWTDSTERPIFTAAPPPMIELGCNPEPGAFPDINTVLDSAVDDCGIASRSFNAVTNGSPCALTATYTWTAVDDCGATGTTETVINWTIDDTPPTFIECTPAFTNLGCNPVVFDFPPAGLVLAAVEDDCGIVSSRVDTVRTTNDCLVTITERYMAVDACSQTGTCQRVIQFTQIPPIAIICPDDGDLGCNPTNIPPLVATAILCGGPSPTFPVSTITRDGCDITQTSVFTATNICGDIASCTQVFTWVEDTDAPVLDCTETIMVASGNPAPALVLPSAQDVCGATVSAVTNVLATNVLGDVEFEVVYTARDCAGEEDQCTVTVLYELPVAPQFDCPPEMDLGCNPTLPSAAMLFAGLSNACPLASSNVSETVDANGCERVLTRVATATDICGGTATCTQIVRWVVDLDIPVFSNCSDIDLGCNPDAIPTPDATATDTCSGTTISVAIANAVVGCQHTETRIYTASDACGNLALCTQRVTWVEDSAPPAFEGCPDVPVFVFPGQPIVPPEITADDDCGIASLTAVTNALSTNANGDVDTEIMFTATDCADRTVMCRVLFTYNPAGLPPTVIPCQGATPMGCDADFSDVPSPRNVLDAISGPCGVDQANVAINTRFTECGSTLTRTYTVVDGCGREVECVEEFVNSASDTTPPALNVPADVDACGGDISPEANGMATAEDTCSAIDLTFEDVRIDKDCRIRIVRTWTAADACGNTAVGTQEINLVNDGEPPTLNCPASIPIPIPNNSVFTGVPDLQSLVSVNDNCGNAVFTQDPPPGSILGGPMSVSVTVIDGCGNHSECTVQLVPASATEATVGNQVWEDLDGNGLRDPDEPPVVGLSVSLFNALGEVVATTTTDENGLYIFVVDLSANRAGRAVKGSAETFSVGFSDASFQATTSGGDSSLVQGTTRTALFSLTPGESKLDVDLGLIRGMSISGVIWNDLNNDNDPSNENLAMLGLNGIAVSLFRLENGTPVAVETTTTAELAGQNGIYVFANLLAGTYQIQVDTDSLPDGNLTPAGGVIEVQLADGENITLENMRTNFGFTPTPAAVQLVSLDAAGDTVQWATATELDTLGFHLVDTEGRPVTQRLVLAEGNDSAYQVVGLAPGEYTLVEIDIHLDQHELGTVVLYPERDATPIGQPTKMLEVDQDGMLEFVSDAAVNSYLVKGVGDRTAILDMTNPEAPVRLRPVALDIESGKALYFSPGPNRRIQIK